MVDKPGAAHGPPGMQRQLQRLEDEARLGGARHAPADDPPGIGVDDEGDIDEARPGGDIGEVGDPQPVRRRRPESPGSPGRADRARPCCRSWFSYGLRVIGSVPSGARGVGAAPGRRCRRSPLDRSLAREPRAAPAWAGAKRLPGGQAGAARADGRECGRCCAAIGGGPSQSRGSRITDSPRTILCRPNWRIRRAIVRRAASNPSRPSCRQTLRTP
jgi:hypothetical protein